VLVEGAVESISDTSRADQNVTKTMRRRIIPDETRHDAAHASGATSDDANAMIVVQTLEQQRVGAAAHGLHNQVSHQQHW
jgi:hypothetical protein